MYLDYHVSGRNLLTIRSILKISSTELRIEFSTISKKKKSLLPPLHKRSFSFGKLVPRNEIHSIYLRSIPLTYI